MPAPSMSAAVPVDGVAASLTEGMASWELICELG
jgi:hypothetical protein